MQREEPYPVLTYFGSRAKTLRAFFSPEKKGADLHLVHGCRQLVS